MLHVWWPQIYCHEQREFGLPFIKESLQEAMLTGTVALAADSAWNLFLYFNFSANSFISPKRFIFTTRSEAHDTPMLTNTTIGKKQHSKEWSCGTSEPSLKLQVVETEGLSIMIDFAEVCWTYLKFIFRNQIKIWFFSRLFNISLENV